MSHALVASWGCGDLVASQKCLPRDFQIARGALASLDSLWCGRPTTPTPRGGEDWCRADELCHRSACWLLWTVRLAPSSGRTPDLSFSWRSSLRSGACAAMSYAGGLDEVELFGVDPGEWDI